MHIVAQSPSNKPDAFRNTGLFADDMPTTSIFEQTLEKIYGTTGLNIEKSSLACIKKSYCYLEFLCKLELVKTNPSYASYQNSTFKDFMKPLTNNKALMPTAALVKSTAWQAIKITEQDLVQSNVWQNIIKAMVCDIYNGYQDLIIDVTQTQDQIFSFIPNLSTLYNSDECTKLRLYQESLQTQQTLLATVAQKYLVQSKDWQTTTIQNLLPNLQAFKKSPFYIYSHSSQSSLEPLNKNYLREQIVCYAMFMQIQVDLNNMLTPNNLAQFLTKINGTAIAPNFFAYTTQDFIMLSDMLALQTLQQNNFNNPRPSIEDIRSMAAITKTTTQNSPQQPAAVKVDMDKVQALAQDPQGMQDQVATIIFQKLPTACRYENLLETIYGKSGLNIDPTILDRLKKSYCYLEFLIKIDKVAKNPAYAAYQKTDFKDFINNPTAGALLPTSDLVASAGWKAIDCSNEEMIAHPLWQFFIKAMVCDIIDDAKTFILDSAAVNNQMTANIFTIESSYETPEFTQMRLYSESILQHQALQLEQKNRYLAQIPDWKNLHQQDLNQAIKTFKTMQAYTLTHSSSDSMTQADFQKKYSNIASPTKEIVLGYYLFVTAQEQLYDQITTDNIQQFLTTAATDQLAANIFNYTPADYICLQDYLVIQDLIDDNKDALQQQTRDAQEDGAQTADNSDDDVVIQKIMTSKEINRSVRKSKKKTNAAIQKSIDKTNDAFQKSIKKTNSDNKKTNRAVRKSTKKTNEAFMKGLKKLPDLIGTGVIELVMGQIKGVLYTAKLFYPKLDAKKLSDHCKRKMMKYKKIVGAVVLTVVIVVAIAALVVVTAGGATPLVTVLMAPINGALWAGAAAASTVTGAAAAVSATAAGISAGTITATTVLTASIAAIAAAPITTAVVVGATAVGIAAAADKKFRGQIMNEVMMPMMQGMQAMTDALTVGFIEIAAGTTLVFGSFGQALGYPINPKLESARVRAHLEKNRASVNMAMSIVVTILITIALAFVVSGVSALYASAARSGMLGQSAAAVALETAATDAAVANTAAQASVNSARANLIAAQASGKQAAISAAQKALTIAESTAAKSAAQASATAAKAAVARQTVINSTMRSSVLIEGSEVVNPIFAQSAATLQTGTASSSAVQAGTTARLTTTVAAADATVGSVSTATTRTTASSLAKSAATSADDITYSVATSTDDVFNPMISQSTKTVATADAQASSVSTSAAKSAATSADDVTYSAAKSTDEVFNPMAPKNTGAESSIQSQTATRGENYVQSKIDQALIQQQAPNIEALTTSQIAAREGFYAGLKHSIYNWEFLGMQILNGVFTSFSIIAGYNQDQATERQQRNERKTIESLWKFIENSKISILQAQQGFTNELRQKNQIALQNQACDLQYYTNLINSSINLTQDQISQVLAQQYIQMLTPDVNDLKSADIGSSWGLQTPFFYLYPSQGFMSATLARPDFPYAQEVAQAPLTIKLQGQNDQKGLLDTQTTAAKLWFNQRAVAAINTTVDIPLDVEIKFRIIYKLNTGYHVGLYLGGTFYNYGSDDYLASITDSQRVDMNTAHLAKMFVITQDQPTAQPTMGLYEHEGKGWIMQEPLLESTIDTATIYHMKAHLDQNQLTVSYWTEGDPNKIWQKTVNVTACNQQTIGMIFSGVAVEWNVVKPTLQIQESRTARAANALEPEADRERTAKKALQELLNPQFASMILTATSKSSLLNGIYLYTTTSTNLVDAQGNALSDYVVFAYINDAKKVSQLGQSPQSNPATATLQPANVLVSLISGNVYDASGNIVRNLKNIIQAYAKMNNIPLNIKQTLKVTLQSYKPGQVAVGSTPTSQSPTPQAAVASQTIEISDITPTTPPVTSTIQVGLTSAAPAQIVATTESISQLQDFAAGPAGIAL